MQDPQQQHEDAASQDFWAARADLRGLQPVKTSIYLAGQSLHYNAQDQQQIVHSLTAFKQLRAQDPLAFGGLKGTLHIIIQSSRSPAWQLLLRLLGVSVFRILQHRQHAVRPPSVPFMLGNKEAGHCLTTRPGKASARQHCFRQLVVVQMTLPSTLVRFCDTFAASAGPVPWEWKRSGLWIGVWEGVK